MIIPVALIIPTIAGREQRLKECLASVKAQTHTPKEIHVGTDSLKQGPAYMRNRLVGETDLDWIAFLDDDDIVYPNHLETLWGSREGNDVIYPDCDGDITPLPRPKPFEGIHNGNFIPITTLVRRAKFDEVGGFDTEACYEDWDLWKRIDLAGGKFHFVPTKTWFYRSTEGSRTSTAHER